MRTKLFLRLAVFATILLYCNTSTWCENFAWEEVYCKSEHFKANFPCLPKIKEKQIKNIIVKTFACESSLESTFIRFYINLTGYKNRGMKYKKKDVRPALKNYVTGGLQLFGIKEDDIYFGEIINFKGNTAIAYYTDAISGGIVSEGISLLMNGKHLKIGVMYKKTKHIEAQKILQHFLDSFQEI